MYLEDLYVVPEAQVTGLDSSLDMLKEAKATYPNIAFVEGDLAHFNPGQKVDCIFANAALQWVQAHELLILKLLGFLNSNGVLAIQIPNNFHCGAHQDRSCGYQENKEFLTFSLRL